jgi:hypothetical protein
MRRFVIGLCVVATGCLSVPVRPPALQFNTPGTGKWEYRQEVLCRDTTASVSNRIAGSTELLNRLGRDGWELVAVIPTAEGAQQCWTHTFKRRLRER